MFISDLTFWRKCNSIEKSSKNN